MSAYWSNNVVTTANNMFVNVGVTQEPDFSGEEVKEHRVELPARGRQGVVNLWRNPGEEPLRSGVFVGEVKGYRSYVVVMREGGWLYVNNARIYDWYTHKEQLGSNPTFDIWGEWYDEEETVGKDGEPYLLEEAKE